MFNNEQISKQNVPLVGIDAIKQWMSTLYFQHEKKQNESHSAICWQHRNVYSNPIAVCYAGDHF